MSLCDCVCLCVCMLLDTLASVDTFASIPVCLVYVSMCLCVSVRLCVYMFMWPFVHLAGWGRVLAGQTLSLAPSQRNNALKLYTWVFWPLQPES